MSKNIKITAGDKQRNFSTINKLITPTTGNYPQAWIPEDEASKYGNYLNIVIDKEGRFYIPNASYDGFLTVTVNVPETTSVTGTQDGTQVTYYVDENGVLQYDEIVEPD